MEKDWYYPRGGLTPDALMNEYEAVLGVTVPRDDIFARYTVAFQAGLERLKRSP